RHAVAGAVLLLFDVRILDAREHAIAAPLDAHQHFAGACAGLDAVVDGVLEQRLQHQRRQQHQRTSAITAAQPVQYGSRASSGESTNSTTRQARSSGSTSAAICAKRSMACAR